MNFSIILNKYDLTKVQNHMTMACLAAIRKFTEPLYEIIVVNNDSVHSIRDDYGVLEPYTQINVKNKTVYQCYNIGAKAAKTDRLMFIQNDVFVHEGTLNNLNAYLEKWDVAFPQQVPISRFDAIEVKAVGVGEMTHIGQRDAGLLAITREAYNRAGGWDGKYKNLLGEAAFYNRMDKAGLSWTDRTNAFITHIMAANNLAKDSELYNKEMDYDAKLLQKSYGLSTNSGKI